MIDVTKTVCNGMGVYPGDQETIISKLKSIEEGYDLSKVEISLHAGTHIDAPAHYIKGGKTINEFPISGAMQASARAILPCSEGR
jgi:arylformamidase